MFTLWESIKSCYLNGFKMCEPAVFQWRTTQHCFNNIMRVSFYFCSCNFQAAYYDFLWVFATLDWIITGCSLTLSKTGKENNHHHLYVSILKTVFHSHAGTNIPGLGCLKCRVVHGAMNKSGVNLHVHLFVKIEAKKRRKWTIKP